jgi:SAM-dependent methyltransferase
MTQPPPSPLAVPLPWDLAAPAYAREAVSMFETFARAALRLAAPPAGARVVDVACGPGSLAILAARAGHPVDAIDFSPKMIEQLDARVRAESLRVASRLGDGQALPYGDGEFAAAFSMHGLMFFPDRARGFAELARVVARGGRAVVSSWPPFEAVPAMRAILGVMREHAAALARVPHVVAESPLSTDDACRAEMGAAFTDVAVHRVIHIAKFESAAAAWESISSSMVPLVLLRHKIGEDAWRGVDAAGRDAVARALGAGAVEVETTALVTVGVKR